MRRGPIVAFVLISFTIMALVGLVATPGTTGLTLRPILTSEEDLLRAVPLTGGGAAILREGSAELVRPGGRALALARSSPAQTLVLSDDGSWVGVASHAEGAADLAPSSGFELHNAAGDLVWRIGPTDDMSYAISTRGSVVGLTLELGNAERNRLHFYGTDGTQLAEAALPYLTAGRFDPDGMVFFALSGREGLRAYDPRGRELWTLPGVRMFAAARGGAAVAALGTGSLEVVRDGVVEASVPVDGFLPRRIAIAPDGSRVALADKYGLHLYDGASLAPLWSAQTDDAALSWTSVDVAAAGGWVIAGAARDLGSGAAQQNRHPSGEVRVYAASGVLVHKAVLEFPVWNIGTPSVLLDRTGRSALVTTRRAVYAAVLP